MNEAIRGSLVVLILCLMIALLGWGLSSPPTTIGSMNVIDFELSPLRVLGHR
ncbi:hypothetical protein [Exiguobacterium oxidotolerans]|uniref:Uncharacterized protein n=1 Tax=Exiguobacterium oxidotolerans TaxID=223958 RepID=A0A653I725_9BACL|nr:hypothetical protein [Exiguobacterium oxidotolerans]VWX34857.1 hypothetical protein EXIGUO9Y_20003 [Exiguobacterium oxidotolerans]